MIFTKKDLIYFIAFCLIIIFINTKTEKMSNTDITKKIQEVYKIDVNAIRNLSKLANDLTNNGKLVVPGGLEIKGDVQIGNIKLKTNGHIQGGTINGGTINASVSLYGNGTNKFIPWNSIIELKTINSKCQTAGSCATYVQSKKGGPKYRGKLIVTPDHKSFEKGFYIMKRS